MEGGWFKGYLKNNRHSIGNPAVNTAIVIGHCFNPTIFYSHAIVSFLILFALTTSKPDPKVTPFTAGMENNSEDKRLSMDSKKGIAGSRFLRP